MKLEAVSMSCLVFLLCTVCWAETVADVRPPSATAAIESAIAAAHDFSGCVLVRDGGGVIFERAYACADRARRIPTTRDTIYGVASVSKQFTSLAILQLVDAGRLSLSDPITRFFKETPADKQEITLHHLLTHASGLGQNFAADGIRDRDDAVRSILATSLERAVGSGFGYSNDGYTLLAAIVEIASGLDFDRYMREHVFEPTGMTQTYLWGAMRERRPPQAAEFTRDISVENTAPNWGFRGGTGINTTIGDLDKYWTALTNHKLISQRSREAMFSPYSQTRIGPYGYGWFVSPADSAERRWMTRGNEDFGPNGIIIAYPDRPLLIIVLSHSFLEGKTTASREDIPMSRQVGEEIEKALVAPEAASVPSRGENAPIQLAEPPPPHRDAPVRLAGDQPTRPLEEEIRATLKSMEQAMLRGDPLAVAQCYSDDAVLINLEGEQARDRAAVDRYWTDVKNATSWNLEVFSVEGVPNLAIQRGRSTLKAEGDTGRFTSIVDYVHIWKRDPRGRLRIAVDAYRRGYPKPEAPVRASESSSEAAPKEVTEEIRAALTGMERALLRGEPLAVAAVYADDALIIGPRGEEARGRAAIDRYWTEFKNVKDWKLENISVDGAPNLWVQRARSTLQVELPDGPQTWAVEALHIWRRDAAGRLRIAVDAYWPRNP